MLRQKKGFTLIEMLVVVVIIGIIVALAVPRLLGAMQRSKRSRAMAEIKGIATSMGMARMASKPPTGTTVPIATVLPVVAKDPWGGDYLLTVQPNEFIITSYGKDRIAGVSTGSEYDSDIIFKNNGFVAPVGK